MKRTIISIITVAMCAAIAGAKEPAGTLTRFRGEEFTKVMNYTSSDLEYLPGSPRVEIIGSKQARESIMLMSSGDNLMIHASENSNEKEPAKIKVYGNKVESIMLYGSGDAEVDKGLVGVQVKFGDVVVVEREIGKPAVGAQVDAVQLVVVG